MTSSSLADAALGYAARGWLVLPLKPHGKTPLTAHGLKDATTDPDRIRQWWDRWPNANIGIRTGPESGIIVVDVDGEAGERSLDNWLPLPDTLQSVTGGGGRHIFFRHPGFRVGNVQDGKLGEGLDIRGDGGYVVAPPSVHESGQEYAWDGDPTANLVDAPERLLQLLSDARPRQAPTARVNDAPGDGMIRHPHRHNALNDCAKEFWRTGADYAQILAGLESFNQTRCEPPEDPAELEKLALYYASRTRPTTETAVSPGGKGPATAFSWPDPLADEAFHGIAGEIVRAIEPHTEADPAAILIQFLAGFGSIIGRGAYWTAEADRHNPNLFAVLVGETAKGRKGTLWGQVRRILEAVDPNWAGTRVVNGLSSGEGLIHHVRDPRTERKPTKDGKGKIPGYEDVETDCGVQDKRLFVIEPEFSRVLKVCERESNTLSDVLRTAWDGVRLQTLTKNQSDVATGAHIVLVGHITQDELRRLLTTTAAANGFGNRFLWTCVRRSKLLPEGGRFEDVDLEPFVKRLRAAVEFARQVGRLARDETAAAVWRAVYGPLSEGGRGMFGSLTSRAEAQAMRLATLYAVLDCSRSIRADHLAAGLAVWQYAEDSARYLFGDASGDPIADRILQAARQTPDGLTREQIRGLFSGHVRAAQTDAALSSLRDDGKIVIETRQTGGRPSEVIFAEMHARKTR